ncbi:hypothetical protein M0765_023915 [Variovorax sp. S2]|uniref:hypothetical protein n=1 Tax=Variovorax sp. S12S4 TaxID=3029170 RepID=UPI00215BE912|nr:hypothetical protein [Variovorax sp. S12S4]MCR8960662.1 hypothetical protein [Variovorax sp. S12S4]
MTSNATHTKTTNKVVPKMTRLFCASVFRASELASFDDLEPMDVSGTVSGDGGAGAFFIEGSTLQKNVGRRLYRRCGVSFLSHAEPEATLRVTFGGNSRAFLRGPRGHGSCAMCRGRFFSNQKKRFS